MGLWCSRGRGLYCPSTRRGDEHAFVLQKSVQPSIFRFDLSESFSHEDERLYVKGLQPRLFRGLRYYSSWLALEVFFAKTGSV